MYEINVRESSRELTKRDRAMLINISGVEALDNVVPDEGAITIKPIDYVVIDVHNDKSKGDNKDYCNYLIYTDDGVYRTGSNSFWEAFKSIWDIFTDENGTEPFELSVYKSPSRNYNGKYFLSCSLK